VKEHNESDIKIEIIDKNMKPTKRSKKNLKWLSPIEHPFRLTGFPWISRDKVYRRLPLNPTVKITEAVDILANHTAGGQICFQTNTTTLSIRVNLIARANMCHMPATGQCGFDCYIGDPEQLYYCSTTKYNNMEASYDCTFFEFENSSITRNIVINFPLYQGVKDILIGVDEHAKVIEPPALKNDKRIIFYGTSITQGGCASRPGMAYTNIISRRLNVECINLGFSGNGRGEPEMAKIITEIEKPGCIVLDYEANSEELFFDTLPRFINIIRGACPEVPILVVSKIPYAMEFHNNKMLKKRIEKKKFQVEMIELLKDKGDKFIHFFDGEDLLGSNFHECTVDGVHPTDLGFMHMADRLTPIINNII